VQINGKVRDRIMVPSGISAAQMQEIVMQDSRVLRLIEGKQIVKVIAVPGKLVNVVVK